MNDFENLAELFSEYVQLRKFVKDESDKIQQEYQKLAEQYDKLIVLKNKLDKTLAKKKGEQKNESPTLYFF